MRHRLCNPPGDDSKGEKVAEIRVAAAAVAHHNKGEEVNQPKGCQLGNRSEIWSADY